MKKIKIKNGFSLLEVVLGLGLIGLASAAIYGNYNSKRIYANIDRQEILLNDISSRAIRAFSASVEPQATATTQNLINMRAVPIDTYDAAQNVITNVFGGTIEISGTNHLSNPANFANPVPTNEAEAGTIVIRLNNVPDYACSKLGTSAYADNSYSFVVNGVVVKNPGEQPGPQQVGTLTQSCVMGNDNVMDFSHSLFQPDLLDFRVVGNDANREKEEAKNIADLGRTITAPQACDGGATWNAESSHCLCPATTQWNGDLCVPFDSDIGNCSPGMGWNGNSCVPHLKVGEVTSEVFNHRVERSLGDPINNDFDLPLGAAVPNPGLVVENGRRILAINYPEEIINNWQENTTLPSGNFIKQQCVETQDGEIGHWNGYSCSYCTNGSTWDGTLLRCTTTGDSANELGPSGSRGFNIPN